MINEWLQELDRHFDEDTKGLLKCVKYHGPDRQRSLENLRETDIVLTTYHTLASDVSNARRSLERIEWYRLVLDEAHIIRRQNTGLHRTVAEIAARSRWCLTGTPVQNRLEDIGSLLAFLRLKPFHSLSNFKKSIALPFDEGGKRRQLAIERFTLLLDSICLRRTKDLLHLPDQQNFVQRIRMSPEERVQYDQTSSIMFRAVKNQAEKFDQNSTLGMFQVQLQLRILCNHGTWQQLFSWNRRRLHLLDEREAVEASLGRDGEATCSACRQSLPLFGTGSDFRRYPHCRHILCSECVGQNMPTSEDQSDDQCPLCIPLWRPANQDHVGHRVKQASQEDTYFRTHGKSSKMEALMYDIVQNVWATKR
jgi:SWI/SNF-related matrix-associated actin-dependent regulator of chromatin subfamily A3